MSTFPHAEHSIISLWEDSKVSINGSSDRSLFFNKYRAILCAERLPKPGSLEISVINFSIADPSII